MIYPDAKEYNPDPDYLRDLVAVIGWTQAEIAGQIGVPVRTFRDYLSLKHPSQAPYSVQFAIECLALNPNP